MSSVEKVFDGFLQQSNNNVAKALLHFANYADSIGYHKVADQIDSFLKNADLTNLFPYSPGDPTLLPGVPTPPKPKSLPLTEDPNFLKELKENIKMLENLDPSDTPDNWLPTLAPNQFKLYKEPKEKKVKPEKTPEELFQEELKKKYKNRERKEKRWTDRADQLMRKKITEGPLDALEKGNPFTDPVTHEVTQEQIVPPEFPEWHIKSSIISELTVMADKFDSQGKTVIAAKIDDTLESFAGRPKAPLKGLDDSVKKDLLKFLHNVCGNLDKSKGDLEEFFRRLRYFNIDDTIGDMGLDKVLKEVGRTHECMDGARKRFYEISFGRRPGKEEFSKLFETKEDDTRDPLTFFESQTGAPKIEDADADTEEDYDDDLDSEEEAEADLELQRFWQTHEDFEDEENNLG